MIFDYEEILEEDAGNGWTRYSIISYKNDTVRSWYHKTKITNIKFNVTTRVIDRIIISK